eukprot:363876-Rhodomonas_salina.1
MPRVTCKGCGWADCDCDLRRDHASVGACARGQSTHVQSKRALRKRSEEARQRGERGEEESEGRKRGRDERKGGGKKGGGGRSVLEA